MVIFVCWSKTNQNGEEVEQTPIVGDNQNKLCLVRWLLFMINKIPARLQHNLFSFPSEQGLVPITYRDMMVHLRKWVKLLGHDEKAFSSHSMRWGATTLAFKKGIPEQEIKTLGNWKSDCYKRYIETDVGMRVNTWLKLNK